MKMLLRAFIPLLLSGICSSQSTHPVSRPNSTDRIVIQEIAVTGAASLDNSLLGEITGSLTAREANDDNSEVAERIRDAFQQRGYFKADVSHVKIRPLDPLARPMPVRIEAEVSEGPRFKFSEIDFGGYNAFSPEQLRAVLPIQPGDYADTSKIRSGLSAIRELYTSHGYLDALPSPSTQPSGSDTMRLAISVREGAQYRMGSLELVGKTDRADELQLHWKLTSGEPYDESYLSKFLEENAPLLPKKPAHYISRDCRDHTIEVHVVVDDNGHRPQQQSQPCEAEVAKTEWRQPLPE